MTPPSIGLGTAQFGSRYGVASGGRVRRDEVRAILARAASARMHLLDTAPAYGDAESILGALGPLTDGFEVVTKTPAGGGAAAVRPALLASLARLGRGRCKALLVHDRRQLLGDGDALFAQLVALRDEGLVERIGVSVYHPEEADALLERYPLEVVQIPLNVLDQRALATGTLARLAARGVEVHVRSVFLQGLLLMDPAHVPDGLAAARPVLQAFRARAADLGLTALEAALGFVRGVPGVDVVLCGVDSAAQIDEIDRAWRARSAPDFTDLATDDRELLDPSRWRVGT